jgi:hypothetical protein
LFANNDCPLTKTSEMGGNPKCRNKICDMRFMDLSGTA